MKGRQVDVVPAAPGWAVVVPVWEGHRDPELVDLRFEPVIAWRFESEFLSDGGVTTFCAPLTVEGSGLEHCEGAGIVRRPNGSFTAPSHEDYAGLDDVWAVLKEERVARVRAMADRERVAAEKGVDREA